jgi:hypothetical protein
MDGCGLASGEGIKRIGGENSCAKVSAAKIGKRDHTSAINQVPAKKEQVAPAIAIEIDSIGGLNELRLKRVTGARKVPSALP